MSRAHIASVWLSLLVIVAMNGEELITNFLSQIQQCLSSELYMVAIPAALTIPDFAGAIDYPGEKNRERYKKWFEKYLAEKFRYFGHQHLTADTCYYLRCSILHQGVPLDEERMSYSSVLFARMRQNASTIGVLEKDNGATLWLDPDIFCRNIISAAYDWLDKNQSDPNFQRRAQSFLSIYSIAFQF